MDNKNDAILTVNITTAAYRLGLSIRTVAKLVASGELKSIRVGRRRIIPVSELIEFVKHDHRVGEILSK